MTPARGKTTLRRLAEERLRAELPRPAEGRSPADEQKLLHELLVHQVELEMQNEELRRSKGDVEAGLQKYAELYDFAPMGYFTLDERGAVLEVNLKGAELLGRRRAALPGVPFEALVAPDSQPRFRAFLQETLESRSRQTRELTLLRRPDGPFPAHLEAVLVSSGAAGTASVRIAVIDITALKHTQEELGIARDAAEAADRAKSAFLASMSHEIRTPLSAVVGMLRLLRGTSLDDTQRRYVELATTSADQLLRIIDDILDFSKIDAGKLDFESVAFNPALVVEESVRSLAIIAREKNISLSWRIGAEVPDRLSGDPFRLRQVLVNLIGNAVKFTQKGEVAVNVGLTEAAPTSPPDATGRTWLRFAVRDTGIGIPSDRMDRLFLTFSQVDESTARAHGGTGLGLAISRQLVEMMGGSIGVESEEGRGSVFAFSIPFVVAPAEDRESGDAERAGGAAAAPPPAMLRVLVAEDEPVNREVAVTYLRERGWQVAAVGDGQAALEALASEPFDVVLMDVRMPGLDGFEATRLVREREREGGPRVRIIGLTAHAFRGDRERCLKAGMDDYLAKPVRPETLYAAVERSVVVPPPVVPASGHSGRTALDWLLARLGGGDEKKAELVHEFLDGLDEGLADIREALTREDAQQVAFSGHRLRGLLSVFGFEKGQDLAQEIETLASEARLQGVGDLVTGLEEELASVKLFLAGGPDI